VQKRWTEWWRVAGEKLDIPVRQGGEGTRKETGETVRETGIGGVLAYNILSREEVRALQIRS